jgi:hypothetical protein
MTYTYIKLNRDSSWLHSYTKAMIIFQDGSSWEFIHNFPPGGSVTVERLLADWLPATSSKTLPAFIQYVMRWRNKRKWWILKNKHFFDCFVLSDSRNNHKTVSRSAALEQWWTQRF